jgi:hypothetical protein
MHEVHFFQQSSLKIIRCVNKDFFFTFDMQYTSDRNVEKPSLG